MIDYYLKKHCPKEEFLLNAKIRLNQDYASPGQKKTLIEADTGTLTR